MVLLPAYQHFSETNIDDAVQRLYEFVGRQKRLALLVDEESTSERLLHSLSVLEETLGAENGQCISLDILDFQETSLANRFLTMLELWRQDRPFRINLPDILRHNPNSASPFINRAILWQRLGDRLIEEEDPKRVTLLIIKNLDAADSKTQHDVARLVRFHATHHIRRTFLFTLRSENIPFLEPEIRELVDEQYEF